MPNFTTKQIKFCPYCGKESLQDVGIKFMMYNEVTHRFCTNCKLYFEVMLDRSNHFPENELDYQEGVHK